MKKILIVEDDAEINEALAIRLSASGYDVLRAEDGLMGLSNAVQQQPDLMILDISMPAGDGFSIVERLREVPNLPRIPVLFITASKKPELRAKARELGAVGFLEKPFEAAELLEIVQKTISGGWCLTS